MNGGWLSRDSTRTFHCAWIKDFRPRRRKLIVKREWYHFFQDAKKFYNECKFHQYPMIIYRCDETGLLSWPSRSNNVLFHRRWKLYNRIVVWLWKKFSIVVCSSHKCGSMQCNLMRLKTWEKFNLKNLDLFKSSNHRRGATLIIPDYLSLVCRRCKQSFVFWSSPETKFNSNQGKLSYFKKQKPEWLDLFHALLEKFSSVCCVFLKLTWASFRL